MQTATDQAVRAARVDRGPHTRRSDSRGLARLMAWLPAAVLALVAATMPTAAVAQVTWIGGSSGDGLWNTGTNWSTNTAPSGSFASTLVFAGAPLLTSTNNISNLTLTSGTAIRFDTSGFTLSGSAITLNGNIFSAITSGSNRISFDGITVSAMRTISGSYAVSTSSTTVISSNISGSGGITLGAGANGNISPVYSLTGSNSFSGGLTFGAYHTVNITNASGFGASIVSSTVAFNRGTLNYSGAAATLANNTSFDASGSAQIFNLTNPLSFTGTTTIVRGAISVSGSLTLRTLLADPAYPTNTFTKQGAGTLTITDSARPGFARPVTISGGLTLIGHADALGTGTITLTSGTLAGLTDLSLTTRLSANAGSIGGSSNIEVTNGIIGAAGLTKVGSGTLTLPGNNSFAGTLTNGGGVIRLSGSNSFAGVTLNAVGGSGSVSFENPNALGTAGALTYTTGTMLIENRSGGPLTLASTGGFTQANASGFGFAGPDALTISASTWFFQNSVNVVSSTLTLAGSGTGTGQWSKTGAGTLRLSGSNSFTGAINVTDGVFLLDGASALPGGTGPSRSGGAVRVYGSSPVIGLTSGTFALPLNRAAASGGVAFRDSTGNVGGNGGFAGFASGSTVYVALTVGGTTGGTLTFGGVDFLVSGSTFILGAASATGTVDVQNPLNLNGTEQFIRADNGSAAVDGILSGTISNGRLTKTGLGTLAMTATNVYTGTTTVSAGTLQIGNNGTTGSISNSSPVSVSSGAVLAFSRSNDVTYSGTVNGAGGLTKLSSGTLSLSGTNAFTGPTTISQGVVAIGNVNALQSTSGVAIAGDAGLRYTGGQATFDRNITVTSGTGTVTNAGSGTMTLAGTLSKDNTVLRLTGGAFNVTGLITGATPGTSDLVVDAATVTLSNTNTYDGPTFVINSGSLVLGADNAIPTTSFVTLGDGTSAGTLWLNGYTDAIGGLAFAAGGGTLRLSATSTSAAALTAATGTMTLTNGTLDLAGSGATEGLYRVLSAQSIGGSFASITGTSAAYQVVTTSTSVDYQQKAVLGAVTVTNPAAAIITGGTAAFTYTVANAAASGGASLSFTGTGLSNVAGSSGGSVAGGDTSSATSGLSFTGASTGSNQTGTFTVNAPSAYGSTSATGTVSVNVYDHASGSATGTTIALPDSIVGYSGSLLGITSATIANAAGYRVDLMTTGGTSAGFVSINNVSGIAAGGAAQIYAAAALTGAQVTGSNSLGQTFNLTYADQSALAGASNNLGSVAIAVTGRVLEHALPGFSAPGITDPYTTGTLTVNFGSINEGDGVQSFAYNLVNLANEVYGAGLTAGLDFTGVTADGNGFSSGLTTFNNLAAGGMSSQFSLTFNPSGQGTFNQTFTLSFSDNQSIAGASARRDLTINASVVVVPEPGALALAGIGAAAAAWTLRKRRRTRNAA